MALPSKTGWNFFSLGLVDNAVLHIAEIPAIRSDYVDLGVRSVTSTENAVPFERKFQLKLATARSFLLNVRKDQDYEITMSGVPAQSQMIMGCNGSATVHVADEEVLCLIAPHASVMFTKGEYPFQYQRRPRIVQVSIFYWFLE
jgi:hypothetical protein